MDLHPHFVPWKPVGGSAARYSSSTDSQKPFLPFSEVQNIDSLDLLCKRVLCIHSKYAKSTIKPNPQNISPSQMYIKT